MSKEDSIEEIIHILQSVMIDPTRVAIWFEILRKPGITAKELMRIINIKKTAMYYHLNLLEESNIVTYSLEKKLKHYKIRLNFFELFQTKSAKNEMKQRNFDLFSLYIINSLVQREINTILNISEEKYQKRKIPLPHVGMWFCTKEKMIQIKKEYQKLWDKMNMVDEGEGPDDVKNASHAYYWGVVNFEHK